MLGAIAGDIVGSVFEGSRCDHDKLELFGFGSCFTDDTVCTIAVAETLIDAIDSGGTRPPDYATSLRRWVKAYPGRGYGGTFVDWAVSSRGPYGSFSNGGAMRVAAIGHLASSLTQALDWAEASAVVTHNHPEGVRGAQAIASAIWLARHGLGAADIQQQVLSATGYGPPQSVAEYAEVFGLSTRADETVPIALACALEATSWAEAVKNACHVGGDSDTLACMAGGIAEARFGLPAQFARCVWGYLPGEMQVVVRRCYAATGKPAPTEAPVSSEALDGSMVGRFMRILRNRNA